MTYIIAGKYKDRTFLMADCISSDVNDGKKYFVDKIVRSESIRNSFYSMSGNSFLLRSLYALDVRLSQVNIQSDFFRGNSWINQLVEIFKLDIAHSSIKLKLVVFQSFEQYS
jgi:hypothetical protein